jgi:hypothetical protein
MDLSDQLVIRQQNSIDYAAGRLNGADGKPVYTIEGGYRIEGDFRLVWDNVDLYKHRNEGVWMCNHCDEVVDIECPTCGRSRSVAP